MSNNVCNHKPRTFVFSKSRNWPQWNFSTLIKHQQRFGLPRLPVFSANLERHFINHNCKPIDRVEDPSEFSAKSQVRNFREPCQNSCYQRHERHRSPSPPPLANPTQWPLELACAAHDKTANGEETTGPAHILPTWNTNPPPSTITWPLPLSAATSVPCIPPSPSPTKSRFHHPHYCKETSRFFACSSCSPLVLRAIECQRDAQRVTVLPNPRELFHRYRATVISRNTFREGWRHPFVLASIACAGYL